MKMCGWGRHRPGAEMIWDAGYHVTRCARCGVELLRTAGRWWTVPRGHRVMWKPRREIDIFAERSPNPDRRIARHRLPCRYARCTPS